MQNVQHLKIKNRGLSKYPKYINNLNSTLWMDVKKKRKRRKPQN